MGNTAGSVPLDSGLGRFFSVGTLMFSLFVSMSPMPTMYQIYKDKSVKSLPATPYFSQMLSASSWGIYGVVTKDFTCAFPNCTGTFLTFFYIAMFHIYSPKTKWKLLAVLDLLGLSFLIALATIFFVFEDQESLRRSIYSGIGITVFVLFLFSPLITLSTVFKTKSTECLPFDMAFIVFINSWFWTFYGYLVSNDVSLWSTGGLGVILAGIQLICHMLYGDFNESIKRLFCKCLLKSKVIKTYDDELHKEENMAKFPSNESDASSVETFEDVDIEKIEPETIEEEQSNHLPTSVANNNNDITIV